ncbi:GABA permease [Thozetella sp. PMI_491]|nr:GABA permease [Thozetella sp. PMI_491]
MAKKSEEAGVDLAPQTSTAIGVVEPTIKKRFNFWTAVGIAICTSGAWEGWTASIAQGLLGGGSVGLVWGWVFVSVGISCMACALAEFVSMWPSAGGQYVWAAYLSPPRYSRFLSWCTAWFSLAGLWLGALSCGMGVAVQVQSYAMVTHPEYNALTWHAFLINILIMIMWIIVNIFFVDSLHWMNGAILVIHVVGYFITIGVLAGTTQEKHDAAYVFADFENSTGWDSNFVSWSVSLLSALYAYFSLDTASHYSEEIERADIMVPRAMLLQALGSAITTFPFIIAVLFCIGDAASVLESPIGLMSPFTQVLINSTGNVGAGVFLNAISTSVAFAAGFDLWGAASRALWSLARDGGLPGAMSHLHPKLNVPILANLVLVPPSIVVYMIYIWNTTAFYGIMAGVLVAFQLSYVIPIGLNLCYSLWYQRHVKGPFSLGKFALPINIVAFIFGCFMIMFMSFPVYYPVTAPNMNYASAIVGGVFVFSIILWVAYGSRTYTGPPDDFRTEQLSTEAEDGSK